MLRKQGFRWSGISSWKKICLDSEHRSVDLTIFLEHFKSFFFFFNVLVNSQHNKRFLAPCYVKGLNKTFELEDKWTLDWVIFFKINIHSKNIISEQLCKAFPQMSNVEVNLKIYCSCSFLRSIFGLFRQEFEIQYIEKKSRYCSYSRKDSWKSFQI